MSSEDELIDTIKYKRKGPFYDFWVNDAGDFHRVGGPAVVYGNGGERWYINGKLHREDGPAVTHSSGRITKWYFNGHLHREGAPAVDFGDVQEWWEHGVFLSDNAPLTDLEDQ